MTYSDKLECYMADSSEMKNTNFARSRNICNPIEDSTREVTKPKPHSIIN